MGMRLVLWRQQSVLCVVIWISCGYEYLGDCDYGLYVGDCLCWVMIVVYALPYLPYLLRTAYACYNCCLCLALSVESFPVLKLEFVGYIFMLKMVFVYLYILLYVLYFNALEWVTSISR